MPHDPQPRPACEDGSGALTALDGSPPSSYKSRRISRNVYFLGLLSLFNDVTADMITPLLPVYLATMGLGASFLGAMEGLANSVSNMTMLFSGWYADRKGNSRALTVGGYRLSTLARLFYFFPFPNVTLAARVLDRVGKGIHTAPRDKLITSVVDSAQWGEAFGIQRAMDHVGSLIGPLIATAFLAAFAFTFRTLFFLASLPAVLSVLIVPRFLRFPGEAPSKPKVGGLSWARLPKALKTYAILMFFSALTSPSELFLIMKMKQAGLLAYQLPLAWFVMTFFTLIATYVGGRLSDIWSRRRTIALGWSLFALIYVGFAFSRNIVASWLLMAGYGFHTGLLEPAERSYPAHISDGEHRATALGWYYFSYGMGLLPASLLFGLLWDHCGARPAFLLNAVLTALVTPFLMLLPSDRKKALA